MVLEYFTLEYLATTMTAMLDNYSCGPLNLTVAESR